MPAATLSGRIAAFASGLDGRRLPGEAVAALKLAALDGFAAILAGVGEAVSRRAADLAAAGGEATIVGRGLHATVAGAAFANGTAAHACDYDDSSWTMWGHPTAPVLPAALAVAEARGRSGLDLLAAFAVGLEAEKTLGLITQPDHYRIGWHPTGTLGVFGAAAAAAKALGLAPAKTEMALGIAASSSAAIRANVGTMTKPLHVGFAARGGVEAALLARAGVTASARALEGEDGFLAAYAPGRRDWEAAADRLGDPFEVVDPGLVFKLYPCCADLHASVDAILELRAEHGLAPDSVRRIRCGVTPLARNNAPYPDPRTPLEAKFSQEYVLAAALVRGRLGLAEFKRRSVGDPAIRSVMRRVECRLHPDLQGEDSVGFASPAHVAVETADGRLLERLVREPKGHFKKPLSEAELREKFRACAEPVLGPNKAGRAEELILSLENVKSVGTLVRALVPSRPSKRRRKRT
jgi:2-methylcitrate dehydratase PrpD